MADTGSNGYILNNSAMSVAGCVAQGRAVVCSLVFNNKTPGVSQFTYDPKVSPWNTVLRDNLKEMHAQTTGYFVDGRCKHVNKVTLDKDESIWFNQEFEGPIDGLTDGLIIFGFGGRYTISLHTPIQAAQ